MTDNPPSDRGGFIWYELMTSDPLGAADFYRTVIGWDIPAEGTPLPGGGSYRMIGRADGGPHYTPNEAVSFMVVTEDQAETDRLWHAITGNGGQESACGWCKDRWGFSWQITPTRLREALADPDPAAARRAMAAMMTMRRIDIAAIDAALREEAH